MLGFKDVAVDERMDVAENKVWYLRRNRLFANNAVDSVGDTAHLFRTFVLPKRALVFDQGDPPRLVYLVKAGLVRLARLTAEAKEVTIALLAAGDMFGEDSLFGDAPRSTIAVCMEETLLCSVKADDLFELLTQHPKLALNVAEILSDRLDSASDTIEDLATAKVADRLLHLFERLSEEHGMPVPGGTAIDVRLTHYDIASLIGSTRETVSLEMSLLEKAGRIRIDGRNIVLIHRAGV